jgi:hypothetical protein
MMTDSQIGLLLIAVVTLGAMIGGATAGALVAILQSHRQIAVKLTTDETLTVPVQVRTDPVALRVMIAKPEPITVEVQPVAAEDRADIAARIIAYTGQETGGQIGPRPLARILNVSPSTAQAYIHRASDMPDGYIQKATGNTPVVSAPVVDATTAPTTPPEETITQ